MTYCSDDTITRGLCPGNKYVHVIHTGVCLDMLITLSYSILLLEVLFAYISISNDLDLDQMLIAKVIQF